jgi:hypothetical protein
MNRSAASWLFSVLLMLSLGGCGNSATIELPTNPAPPPTDEELKPRTLGGPQTPIVVPER